MTTANTADADLSNLGKAAVEYAERGWSVFPVHAGTKGRYDNGRSGHYLSNGYNGASNVATTVRGWWQRWPNANIGLNLAQSGLVAVDPDIYKPSCEWHEFIDGREIPETLVQISASGGRHYVFKADPGADYPGVLCPGVDIKHRGYIIIEPSVCGGNQYRWETNDEPAEAPSWLPIKGQEPDIGNVVPLVKDNSDRVAELLSGVSAHDNSRDLIASLIATGVPQSAVKQIAAGALKAGLPPGKRLNDRLARLDYHAKTAVKKFGNIHVEVPSFDIATADTLASVPVKQREWLVDNLIPAGDITLLNGDGGTGKSLLSLQLAVATAAGRTWINQPVRKGTALFLTAEDTQDELHRRLNQILRRDGSDYEALANLHLLSLAGKDAILAAPGRGNILSSTGVFEALKLAVERIGPSLLVLDTLADLFGGEENQRAQARQFIGLLRGICIEYDLTIVLLAHPSLSGLSSGSGSSGSTGWNNSVRSRLYLERVTTKDADGLNEANPDTRQLSSKKSNYGPTCRTIDLLWQDGAFVSVEDPFFDEGGGIEGKAERVFLSLLSWHERQNLRVSPNESVSYAPKIFANHPKNEGLSKSRFRTAMAALLDKGKIAVQRHGPPSKQRSHLEIVKGG